MACFNETGDKLPTDQETLRSRPAADGQMPSSSSLPPPSQAVCFDCSICLDPAVDPVVTLCGHLYCWPCLYKWMQAETGSPKPMSQHRQCPVCKAPVSENALVPLYGRGSLPTKRKSHLDVPARPNAGPKLRFLVSPPNIASSMMEGRQQQQPRLHYGDYPAPRWAGTSVLGSTAGGGPLLGLAAVAVHPLMSRSGYSSRQPYRLDADGGTRSQRERRREMVVEESLRQIWTFLFCGAVLCLLFF